MVKQKKPSSPFGQLLSEYREKTRDSQTRKCLTQIQVSEKLYDKFGLYVHRNMIGKWELGKKQIYPDERAILIGILAIYFSYNGISSLDEANWLMETAGYMALSPEEITKINPQWTSKTPQKTTPNTKQEGESLQKPYENKDSVKSIFQIPALPVQGVLGREDALIQITNLLAIHEKDTTNIAPVALRGMGGIGKTTLAMALANMEEIQSTFYDGVLWTSLGPKPTVRLLLDAWGRTFGVDLLPERDENACQIRLRQVLHDRHMLIIVDDVWNTIQGKYFEVGGPFCRTIFTTREGPIANDLATHERALRVEVLKPEFALKLLYKLAPATAIVDKKLADRLCEKLEYLPLGLTLAGRMLANEAGVPERMQRLLGELIDRREARLQLLQSEGRQGIDDENPVSLQAILGMSIDRLNELDRKRFAMLSVFGGEPLTWEINAVSDVWECSPNDAQESVSRFIQRGLVEPHGQRYWMHALLADYAAELMEQMDL